MIRELLQKLDVEEVHKRIGNTRHHSLYQQLLEDVKTMRKLGEDIPLCTSLLEDVAKPSVHRNAEMRMFYAGMLCILNIILEDCDENVGR